MKEVKRFLALVLALVMAVGAFACVSCAKKEEAPVDGKVSYTIINNTGKNVTQITLSDTRSESKVESKPEGSGLPDGQSIGIEQPAKLVKNAPDVMFGFTVEGGDNMVGHIMQQHGTITMLNSSDGITYQISEPGK